MKLRLLIIFLLFSSPVLAANDPAFRESISIREYVDMRLNSIEKATALALSANDRRLDGMNEFRETLKDQAYRFATTKDYESLRGDVQSLKETRAELAGKASQQSVLIAQGISLIGICLAIISLMRKPARKTESPNSGTE